MKKIALILGVLFMTLIAGLTVVSPAQAEGEPVSEVSGVTLTDASDVTTTVSGRTVDQSLDWFRENCFDTTQSGDKIRTCIKIGWRKQDDGYGIAFEDVWIRSPEGCGHLEGGIYRNVIPKMYKHNEHTWLKSGDWGNDTCGLRHHDFAWRGEEGGSTDFRLQLDFQQDCYLCKPYRVVWRGFFGTGGVSAREAFIVQEL